MRIDERTPVSEDSKQAGYEVTDAQPSPVVVALVVLVGLMFAGFVGGKVFEDIFEATEVKSRPAMGPMEIREEVRGPLLQPHPEVELADYRAAQKQKLSAYAWIDRDQKKVQLPIERAMELVAKNGIPSWKPVEAKLPEKKAPPPPAPPAEAVAPVTETPSEAAPSGEAEVPATGEAAAAVSGEGHVSGSETESSESSDFTGTESLPD